MIRETRPPFEHPPANIDAVFKSTVLPFFVKLAHPASAQPDNLRQVFLVQPLFDETHRVLC
jgi:hypothetical protein